MADTGPGIRREDLERIFAPSNEAFSAASEPNSGTGLGLTIAKLLTGIMGGQITVRSTPGEGSAFTAKLLLSEVMHPRPPAVEMRRVKGYVGARRTVLVVDDDPIHRDLMVEILEPLGFILLTAPDGKAVSGSSSIAGRTYFCSTSSCRGWTGGRWRRSCAKPGHCEARIVMLSANSIDAHQHAATEPAHDDFLMKPVDARRLLDLVLRLLGLTWDLEELVGAPKAKATPRRLTPHHLADLNELGAIGFLRGIEFKLDEIAAESPDALPTVERLRAFVDSCDLARYMDELDLMKSDD